LYIWQSGAGALLRTVLFLDGPAKLLHKYLRRHERILAMKKILLGVIIGMILIFTWVASYKARKAEQAAREAAKAAASQAPVR
jgi:hypothetical protein